MKIVNFHLDPKRCSHTKSYGYSGRAQCPNRASLNEGGQPWCKIHAPSSVKAREEKTRLRWKAVAAKRDRHWNIFNAKEVLLKAVMDSRLETLPVEVQAARMALEEARL